MALLLNQITSSGNDMGAAGANHAHGLVPDPGSSADAAGANRFLRSDATFKQVDMPSLTSAGQLPGTITNDNAPAGDVGEYVTSSLVTGVGLSNNSPTTITSISLTAGDWDIDGVYGAQAAAATTLVFIEGEATLTGNSFASPVETGSASFVEVVSGFGASSNNMLALATARGSFAVTTTVFLVVEVTFSAGSVTGQGRLRARRMR